MTPRQAYTDQKHHATARGIVFHLTYEDFLEMWLTSGKWGKRGKTSGSFCMCRYGDMGPYSKENCFIGTVEGNLRDRWAGREKVNNAKALHIIEKYLDGGTTQRSIAEEFNVDQSYVSRIVNKVRKKNAHE